jgi:FixJ family two-component response regulator
MVKPDAARTFVPCMKAAFTMATKPLNVVLVEDDLSLGQAMERVLQAAGFQTWVFPSGESLLNSRAAQHASCFVFDVQLPGITGFELRKALEGPASHVPLIFITAHDEPEVRIEAEANAALFLVKPFSGRRLIDAVHRALLSQAEN